MTKANESMADHITRAADYIEAHGLWQGSYYKDGWDPKSYIPESPCCAVGALHLVCWDEISVDRLIDYAMVCKLIKLIEAELGPQACLVTFNDVGRRPGHMNCLAPLTQKNKVVALFRRAAAKLKDI